MSDAIKKIVAILESQGLPPEAIARAVDLCHRHALEQITKTHKSKVH